MLLKSILEIPSIMEGKINNPTNDHLGHFIYQKDAWKESSSRISCKVTLCESIVTHLSIYNDE